MIGLIFYLAFLSILVALIFFMFRQKGSYFRSVQLLFVTAFSSFALVVLLDLIKNHLVVSESMNLYATKIGTSAILIAAIAVEYAALTLYKGKGWFAGKGKREKGFWKEFFSEKLNWLSIIYSGYIIFVLILTWALTPWQTKLVRHIWGELVYTSMFEWWYLTLLLIILIVFIAYPGTLLILSSRKRKEKPVANALKGLGVCWIGVGVNLIIFHGFLRSLGLEMIEVDYLLNVVLFGIVAYLFKKTTVLESFFGVAYSPLPIGEGEAAVVLYTPAADKMKVFSAFIREGIENGDMVDYAYPDEESETVRAKLKERGINVEKYERNGTLKLTSLTEWYLPNGKFDKEGAIKEGLDYRAESKRKGYRHYREITDVGDFSFLNGKWQKYLDYWNDPRWGAPGVGMLYEPFIIELAAVNVGDMSETQATEILKAFGGGRVAPTKLIDLIEWKDRFSKSVGLTHQQMTGRNILLEFDPASDYEKPVREFVTEALANVEPVALFTSKGSVIHSDLSNREAIKLLLLTQRISVPQVDASTNEILLPANNVPLMLDALDKTLKTRSHCNLNIVFDSLSSLVSLIGFEKTYSFVRYALDMLASENSTALFLFNPDAHDQTVTSSLRTLFSNHVSYGKEGLQVVKLFGPS